MVIKFVNNDYNSAANTPSPNRNFGMGIGNDLLVVQRERQSHGLRVRGNFGNVPMARDLMACKWKNDMWFLIPMLHRGLVYKCPVPASRQGKPVNEISGRAAIILMQCYGPSHEERKNGSGEGKGGKKHGKIGHEWLRSITHIQQTHPVDSSALLVHASVSLSALATSTKKNKLSGRCHLWVHSLISDRLKELIYRIRCIAAFLFVDRSIDWFRVDKKRQVRSSTKSHQSEHLYNPKSSSDQKISRKREWQELFSIFQASSKIERLFTWLEFVHPIFSLYLRRGPQHTP